MNAEATVLKYSRVFVFRDFLNTSVSEIRKSKSLGNKSLNKLPINYYFEILVVKYLKNLGTQTHVNICYFPFLTMHFKFFFFFFHMMVKSFLQCKSE